MFQIGFIYSLIDSFESVKVYVVGVHSQECCVAWVYWNVLLSVYFGFVGQKHYWLHVRAYWHGLSKFIFLLANLKWIFAHCLLIKLKSLRLQRFAIGLIQVEWLHTVNVRSYHCIGCNAPIGYTDVPWWLFNCWYTSFNVSLRRVCSGTTQTFLILLEFDAHLDVPRATNLGSLNIFKSWINNFIFFYIITSIAFLRTHPIVEILALSNRMVKNCINFLSIARILKYWWLIITCNNPSL